MERNAPKIDASHLILTLISLGKVILTMISPFTFSSSLTLSLFIQLLKFSQERYSSLIYLENYSIGARLDNTGITWALRSYFLVIPRRPWLENSKINCWSCGQSQLDYWQVRDLLENRLWSCNDSRVADPLMAVLLSKYYRDWSSSCKYC